MLNIFVETNIGSDDKQVSFEIEARSFDLSFDHAFGTERGEIDWEFELVDWEGCDEHEAQSWIDANQDELREKAQEKVREAKEIAADID